MKSNVFLFFLREKGAKSELHFAVRVCHKHGSKSTCINCWLKANYCKRLAVSCIISVAKCVPFYNTEGSAFYCDINIWLLLIQLYKMALPIYYSHGRTKYQYTTLLLLVKTEALLSKLQAFRLKWNRFCNRKGRKGHNISLDLRLEKLNNLLKSLLKVLGSNLSLPSAQRVACCLDVLLESIDTDCSMHKDNKQTQCKDKAQTPADYEGPHGQESILQDPRKKGIQFISQDQKQYHFKT